MCCKRGGRGRDGEATPCVARGVQGKEGDARAAEKVSAKRVWAKRDLA